MRRSAPGRTCVAARRGYTLVELLIVVAILGLAGAMVVPSMTQTHVLRIQAAVRTSVADITFMQADALAYQSRRVMVFGQVARRNAETGDWEVGPGSGYTIYAPAPGASSVDLQNDILWDPFEPERPYSRNFMDDRFGGAEIENTNFSVDDRLIFDELGGPVTSLTADEPAPTGTFEIRGPASRFRISIEAYTGRVTVDRTE